MDCKTTNKLQSKPKKIQRKLKKLQHIVFKETGVDCGLEPTKNVTICNVGLVNGLTEEDIFQHFSKYGVIEHILLVPGKSCCFIAYKNLNSAEDAFKEINGILSIGQNEKPVYLLYAKELPMVKFQKIYNELPPGLTILEDFISPEEEEKLLNICSFTVSKSSQLKNRQVKHFGYEFRYDINNVDKNKPLDENIPKECDFLWDRLENSCGNKFYPDQLTVNHYNIGQGIPSHIDTHSAFEDPIISLSLQSSVIMDFRKDNKHICVLLPRRSIALIGGESRYDWTHGITPRKFDIIHSKNGFTSLERDVRVSFTFRKVLRGKCQCNFKSKCDSFKNESVIENLTAEQLEKLHVHQVYENIATHFSDTRHKPWPNVLDFVMSFEKGDFLVDIGCGNGKYLNLNRNIYEIGCDHSFGLIEVCKERGFEAFISNCLNVPLKDNSVDGAISIAVIHHLANEERRLRAIEEMARILKVGGKALVYVWAKDQEKDKEKSSYLKQDRKNRKAKSEESPNESSNENEVLVNGVSLPVHTNRTQFKHSDVLVPWKLKSYNVCKDTFLRFYHVFEEYELDDLCKKVPNLSIIKSYYDQGNWCILFNKTC